MSRRGRVVLSALAAVLLFCLPLLPEILGKRRLVFRDAHVTHWPWRRVAMVSLAAGEVPFVNEFASGGQPMLANPNAVLLYPTLLLEKVLPPACAFNLHYIFHVFWAFFGARALGRRLGQGEGAAFFSGVAFAFSGMMLSYGSAFMNSAAAAAWLPWCCAATLDVARASRAPGFVRAAAAAGIAFGLQFLAGEPVLSLLTLLSCGVLGLVECFSARDRAASRLAVLASGGAAAGLVAFLLSAPLLLPLLDVLPLTYRGQHAYSLKAFAASPFALWRLPEFLFPRFGGNPGVLGPGEHWQWGFHAGETVYIWCVTLGVAPLLVLACAAARRDFWSGRRAWLAAFGGASLLFAFGAGLPFFRVLYQVPALRRFRYPIKFYLLTTLCAALLAGFAAERVRERRAGRRERAVLAAFAAIFTAAILISAEGGLLDRLVAPHLGVLTLPAPLLLPAVRDALRVDALLGLVAVAAVGSIAAFGRSGRLPGYLLGFATLVLALSWGLPLFVSADDRDLTRPPAVARHLEGPGRLYVDPTLPEFSVVAGGTSHPELQPLVGKLARVQIEELIPGTGAAFGVRGIFDADPDGSYGWFNRLAGEALTVSTPPERSRLLRAFGARWVLTEEAATYPEFHPVTGFSVAGRRLALLESPGPLPELRWASRERRVASLSGALDFVRTEAFRPETDVVLPGVPGAAAPAETPPARVKPVELRADRASADVEADAPGHVVFSRTYFRAWKATLDGRPAAVLVANARELAVAVPPGRHRIVFWWDRRPFERGVALQIAGLASIALALTFGRGRSLRERRPRGL
jgi:hypothetical protein